MEGDVIGLSVPTVMTTAGVVLGSVFGLMKWFAVRMLSDIEERLKHIDDVTKEVDRVDADLKRILAELPIHYQRREDAIREYTVINVKLDRLYELMLRGEKE